MLTAAQVRAAFAPIPNLRRLFFRKAGTGEHHLAPLDGLRALALLWVIFCHAGWYAWFVLPLETYAQLLFAPWMLFFWRGDFAVEVFFVMSAFLIGGLLTDEREKTGTVRIGAFYLRRLLRLWPALVAAVVFEYAVNLGATEHQIWPNILYVNNLLPIETVRMGWTWSLAIEEQFYLTVPWLLSGLRRIEARVRLLLGRFDPVLSGLVLIGAAQIAIIAAIVLATDVHVHDSEVVVNRPLPDWQHGYDILYSKPWMRAGPLLVGLGCARLWRRPGFVAWLGATGWKGSLALALAFLLGFVSMHWQLFAFAPRWLEVAYLASYRTIFGLVVGYGMMLVLSPHPLGARLGRFLSLPIFFPMAQLAYCAYLVNPVVAGQAHLWLATAVEHDAARAFFTFAGFDLPLTFFFAILLSLSFERPFMELRKILVPGRT